MTRPVVNVDKLPPTQYLILDVLVARHRLGHKIWPFPSTLRYAIRMLEAAGLIELHSPNANVDQPGWRSPIRASLTPAGLAAAADPDYRSPAEQAEAQAEDAFAFAKALDDPAVRLQLAHDGYTSGAAVVIGRDTSGWEGSTGFPRFRVWRDPAVPGGWTGRRL